MTPTQRKRKMAPRAIELPKVDIAPDAVNVLEGSTFVVSDVRGDVQESTVAGFFHDDTRYLSRFVLTVNDTKLDPLTAGNINYFSAAFYLTNPDMPGLKARSISVRRARFVGDGLTEEIGIKNHLDTTVTLRVRLLCAIDFADLFEVKSMDLEKQGALRIAPDENRTRLNFDYVNGTFRARAQVRSSSSAEVTDEGFLYQLKLKPREGWTTKIEVLVHQNDEFLAPKHRAFADPEKEGELLFKKWRDEVPQIRAAWDLLHHIYRKSIVDLAALRLRTDFGSDEYWLPAAGLPWFMAIFGRDTIITSYQSLWVGPELVRGALHALAELQGTKIDDFRDEQPGRIPHELRFGELTALGLKPHSPYYGTCDATPLWLVLLSEYWRYTHDDACVHELRESAMAALNWINEFGDADGDGYVEYKTRSTQGLDNQGWKDSGDGITFADGRLAKAPIALAEIQGYVFDAKRRMAELAERVWKDDELAARLRRESEELAKRFERDFWITSRGGYYALGLDKDKQLIDSKTSNMGHLLWSGIVRPNRAAKVVKQLLGRDMFSGWGIRTLSFDDAAFNPIGYHTGTVWPHDNSIIAEGFARYGFRDEANTIILGMLEAARYTEHRLPEAFAGFAREANAFPVRYPTACSPQAWATAAPFLFLKTLLGIGVSDDRLVCDPHIPERLGRIFLHGVHAFGSHYDVTGEATSGKVGASE
ncbi:MAG TPA: glycogen debranching N-terminal domain-containing protein [Actinomycetota bacterium]|nr:glycogen debranching N-terminal domain-containing protein [Actinomycetota bacterium]